MKRIKVVLLSLLTIIGLTFAGYKIVEHRTIEKIVQSDEVKTIIESNLKQRHKGALEKGNIIQSYEIDKDSIFVSPMGGIKFAFLLIITKKFMSIFQLIKIPVILMVG